MLWQKQILLFFFSQPNLKTELFNHQFVVQFFEIINNTNNTLKPIEKQTNNSIFLNFIILTLIIISTTYLINFKKSMFEQKINNDQSKYYH